MTFGSEGDVITGMETVAGKVGQAVAQRAVKSWLEERRKSKERTASLAELAAAELSTVRQRKRLEHLAEGIGHQVGDQLEPLLETKFSALPDNEVRAALDAVVDAIDDADLSDEAILDADADPEVLARRIRQQVPNQAGLSELATRLYDLALDQACRYLVQVLRQLPAFQPRALAEVLGRATAQTAQLDEILARLPRTSLHAPQGAENDEGFRGEYLRYIANALDRLELLGLSMRHRPRLSLSVAYLSLTVSEPDDDPRNGAATADKWFAAQDDHRRTRTRVESALTNRTLVRGDAGSGKTTLLDWLAVTAAQGGFTGRLREWNGCVPLPIRLRRYADSPLPAPEQFLDETAKCGGVPGDRDGCGCRGARPGRPGHPRSPGAAEESPGNGVAGLDRAPGAALPAHRPHGPVRCGGGVDGAHRRAHGHAGGDVAIGLLRERSTS
ncbi:NACHT N-terminal Helical domain 1-containing protein [Saccharopolyspora shandongensis]|uniref:NACHT N-terminal Helical domain 1-containing protein n=1 Tax=Saccharopolyspora shandongensis TaxID=418495 RepID=UPI0033DA55F1